MADHSVEFDIGGTWIRAYVRLGARTLRGVKARTPVRSAVRLRAVLRQLFQRVAAGKNVKSVAIGVAGSVRGVTVLSSRNIPALKNFSFSGVFSDVRKLTVDNDARAFLARALARHAALRRGTVLALTFGTGVGRAVARRGKVRKLTMLEHAEPWEKEYQSRRFEPAAKFTDFVITQITQLHKRYQPNVIALSGGVISQKIGFRPLLMQRLRRLSRVKYYSV